MRRQTVLMYVVWAVIILVGAPNGAVAQGFDFQFNVDGILPSAQAAQYDGNVAETAAYSVSGGLLHQNTLSLGGGTYAWYLLNGTFNHDYPGTLEWRVKVDHNDDVAVVMSLATANRLWWVNLRDNGIEVVNASGAREFVVSLDTTDAFHVYKVVIPDGSDSYQLYVDGQPVYASVAPVASGQNTYFGDSTPTGGNASAEWDYVTLVNPLVKTVSIAIKPPADPPVPINLSSSGVVPVAILSSPTFNATTVDPATISLAGASVQLVGRSDRYSCSAQDVNQDGFADLVCHVVTAQFLIQPGDSIAVLEAKTFSGKQLQGQETIRIVPK